MGDPFEATTADAEAQLIGRQLAVEMLPAPETLGEGMAAHIHERISEFTAFADESALLATTEASCTANCEQILTMMVDGSAAHELVVPGPAIEYAEGLVHRRTPLTTLLRSYHLGHGYLLNVAGSRLREGVGDERELFRALDAASSFTFEYIDTISDKLVDAYHVERDRWVRTAAAVRAETVREIIGGNEVNERAASSRLGYELRRSHIAFILSGDPADETSLEREAVETAALIDCADPLLVPAGSGMLWAWCGSLNQPTHAAVARLEAHVPKGATRMAVGRVAYGLEGFRISHREAEHAARFWELSPGHGGGTTTYRAIEIVSLMAADLVRARRFVSAELGALAEQSDTAARMRSTLLAFLAHGGSHVRAAEDLHMHQNTVYNRVRRAEELIGGTVNERRVELQTALMLAETLGPEVLP